jgi:hypothetical protein
MALLLAAMALLLACYQFLLTRTLASLAAMAFLLVAMAFLLACYQFLLTRSHFELRGAESRRFDLSRGYLAPRPLLAPNK